jgi:hypothetical protein
MDNVEREIASSAPRPHGMSPHRMEEVADSPELVDRGHVTHTGVLTEHGESRTVGDAARHRQMKHDIDAVRQ